MAVSRAPLRRRRGWLGLGLTPQAGVAKGMALLVAARYPAMADDLVSVAVAGTILVETVGPILTRRSLG